jgi:hypothetical protein
VSTVDLGQWVSLAAIAAFALALFTYMRGMRTELKGDIAGLRTELKGHIAELRTEMRSEFGDVRASLRELEHRTYDLARQEPASDTSTS